MTEEAKNHSTIENLIVGHFDGTLNEDQEEQLATTLSTSPAAKKLFVSYMRIEGRLHSIGRDGFLREPATKPVIDPERHTRQSSEIAPSVRSGRRSLRLLAASSVAICAAVMLIVVSVALWPSSVSANSVLQRAQAAAAQLIDRTYRVTTSDAGETATASELTVNVGGGGRFLVRPFDGSFVMGSDGIEYWMMQRAGPVWVASDSRSLSPRIRRKIPNMWLIGIAASPNEPLLLDMAGLLSLIQRRYDVELVDLTDPHKHQVRATLKRGRRRVGWNAPDRIDFWADEESGVGLRAEVEWADGRRMQFELVESESRSDQWYHYSQHGLDRQIERLE